MRRIDIASSPITSTSVSIRRARRISNPDLRAALAAETGDGEKVPVKLTTWQLALLFNVSGSAIKARIARRLAAAASTAQAAE